MGRSHLNNARSVLNTILSRERESGGGVGGGKKERKKEDTEYGVGGDRIRRMGLG